MGNLFIIVGPSGSGKDSLINYAAGKLPLHKVRRVITRSNNSFEDFDSVKHDDFDVMDFFVKWESYGKKYGIPMSVLDGLKSGKNFIMNVSRDVIPEIKSKWDNTFVIALSTPVEILKKRLVERGRDSLEEIERRLARGFSVESDLIVDTGNPDISIAGSRLIDFVKEIIK